MSVQLAIYKASGNWLNRLIRWWTGSQYSHCELVIRGTCYSSSIRDGGCSGRQTPLALPAHSWDVIDLPGRTSTPRSSGLTWHAHDRWAAGSI